MDATLQDGAVYPTNSPSKHRPPRAIGQGAGITFLIAPFLDVSFPQTGLFRNHAC